MDSKPTEQAISKPVVTTSGTDKGSPKSARSNASKHQLKRAQNKLDKLLDIAMKDDGGKTLPPSDQDLERANRRNAGALKAQADNDDHSKVHDVDTDNAKHTAYKHVLTKSKDDCDEFDLQSDHSKTSNPVARADLPYAAGGHAPKQRPSTFIDPKSIEGKVKQPAQPPVEAAQPAEGHHFDGTMSINEFVAMYKDQPYHSIMSLMKLDVPQGTNASQRDEQHVPRAL